MYKFNFDENEHVIDVEINNQTFKCVLSLNFINVYNNQSKAIANKINISKSGNININLDINDYEKQLVYAFLRPDSLKDLKSLEPDKQTFIINIIANNVIPSEMSKYEETLEKKM